ncbi:MAG: lysophospholipase [Bacteroidales bacterium]|nr:lysophospholipase [Bacteroidales bacterium]
MEYTTIASADGKQAIDVAFAAPEGDPKGLVQIVHGMCEHKERYFPLMEFLAGNGYVAVCHDHRGHGASARAAGTLGYMGKGGWLALVEDTRTVGQWMKQRWPGLRFTLFGHSMGSMVVRSFAKRYDSSIDSLIVCGCPSDNPAKGAGAMLSKLIGMTRGWHHPSKLLQAMSFGSYNKSFKDEGYAAAWVCSDKAVLEEYHHDPLCQYIFTADGFHNLLLLMKDCYSLKGWSKAHPDLPVHFISGAEDPCRISDKALQEAVGMMRKAGYNRVTLKLYPGMRHEIHNETGKAEVWNDLLSYLA